MAWSYFCTSHFGKRYFGTDISSWGLFGMRTFWHKNIRHGYFLTPWMFQHRDVKALEYFGKGATVPLCLCRNVYIALHGIKMYMYVNVHVPKYSCAELSLCLNVPVPKRPWCRNVLVPKCPHA